MSSENTECLFEIDTSDGWEKSLTKILSSFEDPVFDINPTLGYACVKGKTDRHQILKKLKKGGKHSDLKRITFGSEKDNNNNHQNLPYGSLSKMGPLYDPYYYANDPYNYHSSYANYNPWQNNNNLNHLFLNNARNYYHGPNHHHHLPRPLHGRGSFHQHDSSVPSSSTSSSTTSSSRSVTEPAEQSPRLPSVREPLRYAPSRRLGRFIKKVTGKFRSCLRFAIKSNNSLM